MLKGGIADKLGNGYEALWALIEALRVLRAQADEIRIEPFNEDAEGLEFRISTGGRDSWHQCKRRRRAGSWTLKALEDAGVLSAFMRKLADPCSDCIFVSSDPVPVLKTLTGKAAVVEKVTDFLASLGTGDQKDLASLAKVWPVDVDSLFDWLRRVRVETVSETSLERELTGQCDLLFSAAPKVALLQLAEILDDHVTHVITTNRLRAVIDASGIGWRARLDDTLPSKVAAATENYLASLAPPIANVEIETSDLREAARTALDGKARIVIVSGTAGSGKSLALTRIVAAARERDWPVLAFRIDWYLDARALADIRAHLVAREENPIAVLGNHADNRDCVVVIDQVDAVSEASGRSGRIRDLVFQMIHAARFYPNLRLVVACRTYDLDHDTRLKDLQKDVKAVAVRITPLDWDSAVQPVLARLGLGSRQFSDRQREILAVPINLQIFAILVSAGEVVQGDITGARLFDRLLEVRARELSRAGVSWSPHTALAALASWMSAHQALAAPATVLAAFPGATETLSSHGLITKAASRIQFAHESFFDHVFSAEFVTRGGSVLALLTHEPQRLFRRTQVRQIFARLRDLGGSAYLTNLREVMEAADVRYLIKDAIAAWLASVDGPLPTEVQLVEAWWTRGPSYERLVRIVMHGGHWLPPLIRSGTITRFIENGGSGRSVAFWVLRNGHGAHANIVADYLRAWWGGEPVRTSELVGWFDRLHPDGPIGGLEGLYRDVIAATPVEGLKSTFEDQVELGAWVHKKQYALGAHVLGWWLARWMAAFPDAHPFGDVGSKVRYWIKELADHAPAPFLEAIWPGVVEGLRRDRLGLADHERASPTIRVDSDDDAWIVLIGQALNTVAAETPAQAATYLDALPPEGAPALWLHLRAIAAHGAALGHRLPALLDHPDLLDLGQHHEQWQPFAQAAHAAMVSFSEPERRRVEMRVLGHRPEYERAREFVRWSQSEGKALTSDDRAYACRLLTRTGEIERAILRTIGTDTLGSMARGRLAELERKFGRQPLPEADGIRGGWVRSPISPAAAAMMNDGQWLRAMERYTGNERLVYERNSAIGGADELAAVLQARAKEDPERFVRLLERLPASAPRAYPAAVLRGLRESSAGDRGVALATRAVRTASRWGRDQFRRDICWLVTKFPEVGQDPDVFAELLTTAATGEASDTTVGMTRSREKLHVRDLLRGGFESLEHSGINGDRGVAWEALAAVLWVDPTALESVAAFLERAVDVELTSVRMCMLHAVNAVVKYDVPRGLALLKRLAMRDVVAVHSIAGRHVLLWATYNHTAEVQQILTRLTTAHEDSLRGLGLALEAGLALTDAARDPTFSAGFAADVLRRRVAAYVATDSLSSDTVGERAARWLRLLFHDPEPDVRFEAGLMRWEGVLDGPEDRTDFARAFLASPTFVDDPDHLMSAIEDRVDRFPGLTFDAVTRVLDLQKHWAAEEHPRYPLALHNLGRLLVALYRTVEDDSMSENQLLNLFDTYLATDLRDLGDEIRAYERH